ncbi:hypothetical protein ONS95_004154 [Cadophora gregata]|uniref:uncharacterized protein n=1 Tax=Cadophora gregata TaxID=51156 RepID=UPI0026DB4F61|nr:uncharacterized protein ONS95_004154 [Cadophora gregata]KAK0105624.1 hypothetical protein ONS95_004154 [Cadophora gregata]
MSYYALPAKQDTNFWDIDCDHEDDEPLTPYHNMSEEDLTLDGKHVSPQQESTCTPKRVRPSPKSRDSQDIEPAGDVLPPLQRHYKSIPASFSSVYKTTPEPDETPIVYSKPSKGNGCVASSDGNDNTPFVLHHSIVPRNQEQMGWVNEHPSDAEHFQQAGMRAPYPVGSRYAASSFLQPQSRAQTYHGFDSHVRGPHPFRCPDNSATAESRTPQHRESAQQSQFNQCRGAPFTQPNQSSYDSKTFRSSYQEVDSSQLQGDSSSGTPAAQLDLDYYASNSRKPQRHPYAQDQHFDSLHCPAPLRLFPLPPKSIFYTASNHDLLDKSMPVPRDLGKLKKPTPHEH